MEFLVVYIGKICPYVLDEQMVVQIEKLLATLQMGLKFSIDSVIGTPTTQHLRN
jgi:hypothetical protein